MEPAGGATARRERCSMTEQDPRGQMPGEPDHQELEFGGLQFGVSFREVGATLRVSGKVDGGWKEMLRFDDFVDIPHYHAPADGAQANFDRSLGDPLEGYIAQLRAHL